MESFDTDIAIIGAGPAGAVTSIFLARAGVKHVLFDKAVFPRDKICGDALSGKSISVLKKIDPEILDEAVTIFYGMMGWDPKTGAPTDGKLHDLDIAWVKDYQ